MRLKTFLKAVAVLGIAVFLSSCEDKPKPVGEWIAQNAREAIVFKEDGAFTTMYYAPDRRWPTNPLPAGAVPVEPSPVPGTERWRLDQTGKYEVDLKKTPGWIDLVGTSNGQSRRAEGLIQFLDDNTFYMTFAYSGGARPATMDSGRDKVRFSRAAQGELQRQPSGSKNK